MKYILAMLLIAALLLCGCSATPTETPPPATEPSTTAPSTAPSVDTAKPLTEMTDYELILVMAKKEHCCRWSESSYLGAYPFTVLMYFSPEFTELMSRHTAADSLSRHIDTVAASYPHSDLNALKPFIPDIQAFLEDAATPRTDLTDYELLRTMAEKGVCYDWQSCKNTNNYPYTVIMIHSPEFAELMTRTTAAESIRTYADSLMEQYPNSALDALEPYLQDIEAYTNKNVTN